ncbi:MAG: DASH family cryptochrome [Bacteroidia bacterium]
MKKPYKKSLVWFSNNLRTLSNQVIQDATRLSEAVLFVYVFDSRLEEKNKWDLVPMGPFRKQHLIDAITDFKQQLYQIGIDLQVYNGDPTLLLPEICKRNKIEKIFKHSDYGFNEINDNCIISKSSGIDIHYCDDNYLIPINELGFPLKNLPDVFTQFRIKIEKNIPLFDELNPIQVLDCEVLRDEYQDYPTLPLSEFKNKLNGETIAISHLKKYIEEGHARHYKETRNGLIQFSDSTKLSPFLSMGCLNAKTVMYHIRKHENEFGANESTYWIWFELLWRDYFRNIAAKFGNKIFLKNGIKQQQNKKKFDLNLFHQWTEGETGEPFVDANMKELLQTGWMSNRGRQNVASFWIHDYHMDWRPAAAWFEQQLIDYDVYSNYGNWIYLAGIGNDPRPNRKFNIQKQAEQYDPQAEYRRKWLKT